MELYLPKGIKYLLQDPYIGLGWSDWEEGRCTFCDTVIDLAPITRKEYDFIAKQDPQPKIIRHCGLKKCKQNFGPDVMQLSQCYVSSTKKVENNICKEV